MLKIKLNLFLQLATQKKTICWYSTKHDGAESANNGDSMKTITLMKGMNANNREFLIKFLSLVIN